MPQNLFVEKRMSGGQRVKAHVIRLLLLLIMWELGEDTTPGASVSPSAKETFFCRLVGKIK